MVCKYFFPIPWVGFVFFWFFFLCVSFLVWCSPTYWFSLFQLVFFGAVSKILFARVMSRSFFLILCSSSFIVWGLTFKSLMHFELIFLNSIKIGIQFHPFACDCPMFSYGSCYFFRRMILPRSSGVLSECRCGVRTPGFELYQATS